LDDVETAAVPIIVVKLFSSHVVHWSEGADGKQGGPGVKSNHRGADISILLAFMHTLSMVKCFLRGLSSKRVNLE
jgi:hypothetical protein